MQIENKFFEKVLVIKPKIFADNRGFFYESYQFEKCKALGIDMAFLQDNHSYSKEAGTIRGMHFQNPPNAQSKLIRVVRGAIINKIVDIRRNSPTFLNFESVELSAENNLFLYIPVGFANGFETLTNDCEVLYKVDAYYAPESDMSFAFNDPEIGINWNVKKPILSERDSIAPKFAEIDTPFVYGENS